MGTKTPLLELHCRLHEVDSTQFFQFDCKGNMYIYEPGAGCTGDAKLVKPGDELIFSTSSQWHDRQTPLLSDVTVKEEKAVASTCPGQVEYSRPFHEPLSEESLVELSHKNFAAETLKKVRWVQKMYREWCLHRHSMGLEFIPCDLEDCSTISG